MTKKDNLTDFDIVGQIISAVKDLEQERQLHVLKTAATWLKIDPGALFLTTAGFKAADVATPASGPQFTTDVEMTPKQFMLEKRPRTDVERLACLAYYLTHYRDTPQFRTIDLSKLNTEAAQRKFANAAETAKNAIKTNYFAPASKKGHRQLSADGEQIIAALPDRDAVATIRKRMHPRRTTKRSNRKKTKAASK